MKILITAGPTREYLDSVRFISNASSGQMGYAIASAATRRGHQVVLVTGPVSLDPPPVEVVRVVSAAEMLAACEEHFPNCQAAVMTAAVSDYRPNSRLDHKPAKVDTAMSLTLEPTPDICARLGATKGDRVVVGFAVQDRDVKSLAEEKMIRKHCDAIALNHPAVIGAAETTIQIKVAGRDWREPIAGPKSVVAEALVDLVEELAAQHDARDRARG